MSIIFDMVAVAAAKDTMRDKFPIMVGYFLEDAETYVSEITEAVLNENYSAATIPAHTLKSSSRQMGALRLSTLAKQIEEMARGNNAEMKFFLPELQTVFLETAEGIKKL